jgi:hypothetical protein
MGATDDTQPRSPFKQHPEQLPQQTAAELDTQESALVRTEPSRYDTDYDEPPAGGPGCLMWTLLLFMGAIFSLVIVILAASWGWTEGNRDADVYATATQSEFINIQLQFIATEVIEGNQARLNSRINFLAELTPGVPIVPQLQHTATALYFNTLPTATPTLPPTATPTPELVASQEVVIETPETPAASTGNGLTFDLGQMLADAQLHIRFDEYQDAYELLDAIIRIDPDFQRTTVRTWMNQVLVAQAELLYRAPGDTELAEAIRLTDLAEQYGPIDELNYERIIATYYLDIQSAINGSNHALAISLLNTVIYTYQETYKGQNLRTLLFNEYVAYGDAWGFGNDHCKAVAQYDLALGLFADDNLRAKRDVSQTTCELAPTIPIGATPVPANGEDPSSYTYPGLPPTAAP